MVKAIPANPGNVKVAPKALNTAKIKQTFITKATFAKIPNDRIVIETDAPYCAPVPYRGKTCEPAMVIETARVLAQIKNLQMDDLETILMQNVKQLYPKIKL